MTRQRTFPTGDFNNASVTRVAVSSSPLWLGLCEQMSSQGRGHRVLPWVTLSVVVTYHRRPNFRLLPDGEKGHRSHHQVLALDILNALKLLPFGRLPGTRTRAGRVQHYFFAFQ